MKFVERFKDNPVTTFLGSVVCIIATWFIVSMQKVLLTADSERLWLIIGVTIALYGVGVALILSPDLYLKKFFKEEKSEQNSK
jgi:hypothetical protein